MHEFHVDPPQIRVLKSQQERITKMMRQIGAELVTVGRALRDQGDTAPLHLRAHRALLNIKADQLRQTRLELSQRIVAEQRRLKLPL